jgi:hypothetical protein
LKLSGNFLISPAAYKRSSRLVDIKEQGNHNGAENANRDERQQKSARA